MKPGVCCTQVTEIVGVTLHTSSSVLRFQIELEFKRLGKNLQGLKARGTPASTNCMNPCKWMGRSCSSL